MALPAVMAGLEALLARAAAGGAAEAVAGKATQTVGSKLFAGFMEGKVAKGAVRVYRGVQESGIASEFAAPPAGVPGLKTYQSSRAAAEAAAGAKGQVFRIDLPKASMASYSPSPASGAAGGTQYSVPFAEHVAGARQVVPNPFNAAGSAGAGPSGGQGRGFSGFANLVQPAGQGPSAGPAATAPSPSGGSGARGFSGFVNTVRNFVGGGSGGTPPGPVGSSGSSVGNGTGSGRGFLGYAMSAARNCASGSPAGQMYQGIQNLAAWRPTTPPGPTNVQPYNGGGPSFPGINPSDLMGMAGKSRDDIAQTNATNASQQAFEATRLKNMKDLDEQVRRCKDSFKDIVFQSGKWMMLWGTGIAQYGLGKTITAMNSSIVDNDLETHGQYSAAFAEMKLRRQFQDIQLSRTTARETENSERFLNKQNMEGEKILNRIYNDFKPTINAILGGAQIVANISLMLAEAAPFFKLIKKTSKLSELFLGANNQDGIERDLMAKLIAKSVDMQNQTRDEKRMKPLRKVR